MGERFLLFKDDDDGEIVQDHQSSGSHPRMRVLTYGVGVRRFMPCSYCALPDNP